jgi:translation initiation factor 1A
MILLFFCLIMLKKGVLCFFRNHTIFKLLISVLNIRGRWMGKKKVLSEKDLKDEVLPSKNDILGLVQKMLGFDRVMVKCQDGNVRVCRIRGKMKRRTWIREGDIVLVSPWDFQSDERGEIFFRYTANQVDELRQKGILKIE